MLRSFVLAFVAGWALWFWIDKSPYVLGPLPPVQAGQYLDNFQAAFNLLRAGRFSAAFVFIWKAHYLVLSVALALLFGTLFASFGNAWRRRHMLKLYVPQRRKAAGEERQAPDQTR